MSKCEFCKVACGNSWCSSNDELDLDSYYTHYKKGNKYRIEGYAHIQVDDVWVDAVIYAEYQKYERKYVRSLKEFKEKFSKIEE